MILGIVYAMANEGAIISSKLAGKQVKRIAGFEFVSGSIGANQVVLVEAGVGKVNSAISTALLIENFKPELIINSGIAGGSHGLKMKDIILSNKVGYSDVDVRALGYPLGAIPNMPRFFEPDTEMYEKVKAILTNLGKNFLELPTLTADKFIDSQQDIRVRLDTRFACDMEGASIAQACYIFDVPFVEIRFISDILDSSNHLADYQQFEDESCKLSAEVTLSLLEQL